MNIKNNSSCHIIISKLFQRDWRKYTQIFTSVMETGGCTLLAILWLFMIYGQHRQLVIMNGKRNIYSNMAHALIVENVITSPLLQSSLKRKIRKTIIFNSDLL